MLGNLDENPGSPHRPSLRFAIARVGEPHPFETLYRRAPLDKPAAVANFWRTIIEMEPGYESAKEHLVVIVLDTRIFPVGYNLVAIGGLRECICHPREVLRPCVISAGHGFVLCHNHPSGDPSPSSADHRITSRIRDSATLLQIEFFDHVIVGNETVHSPGFYSFREAGLL
jgi:DNA repair protein RadC